MSQPLDSKSAAVDLIDPMNEPEPSAETGLNASFGSTFAPAKKESRASAGSFTTAKETTGSGSLSSKMNPFRSSEDKKSPSAHSHSHSHSKSHGDSKNGVTSTVRESSGSPKEAFPTYRAEPSDEHDSSSRRRAGSLAVPGAHKDSSSSDERPGRRRGSSLSPRYPGDKSAEPLDSIKKDSRKAQRSPHLHKRSIPGADSIDRLDPAIGGRSYHHEGPFDAAMMSRNRDPKHAPIAALESTNKEALKATPQENIKDAVRRHKPLDGVAAVPPGEPDRFGREYAYKEGTDMMHEPSSGDAGYKRWPGKDYDSQDLKGESEPAYSLDRALQAHRIDENGIEMEDRAHLMQDYRDDQRKGKLDTRDPVAIAGDDSKYVDMELANAGDQDDRRYSHHRGSSSGIGESIKKKIGSLKHRKHSGDDDTAH